MGNKELIIGGNNDGLTLWQHGVDGLDYHAGPMRPCAEPATLPTSHDVLLPRQLASVPAAAPDIIYSVDRSANPWESTIFAVATQPESQYYDDLDTSYHEALRYYDERIGARLHQS